MGQTAIGIVYRAEPRGPIALSPLTPTEVVLIQ